jgi:hypothetical protein
MTRIGYILSFLIAAAAGLFLASGIAAAQDEPKVGGPCDYTAYQGVAVVKALEPLEADNPEAGYRVQFTFTPQTPDERIDRFVEGRRFELEVDGREVFFPAFLETHDLTPGGTFAAVAEVIVQGTCTPLIFKFPELDPEMPEVDHS